MTDNNFDYKAFAEETIERISSNLPEDISIENKHFICDIIKQFINKTGELLKQETFNFEQQQKFCQVVTYWTFDTSIYMIHANLPNKYCVIILESIATLSYEIMREGYSKNINEDEIMSAVQDYVNKSLKDKLDELYAKNLIDKNIYTKALTRFKPDNINTENDHTNCYSLGDKGDKKLLNDRVVIAFAQNLAYRYLMKAAHSLKKVSMRANDRRNVLLLLRDATSSLINNIQTTNFNFSIPQIERVITVAMELSFHRIVMMYKNNILSNNDWSIECVNHFMYIIYLIEFEYIKDNDELKDTYQCTYTIANSKFKEYLGEFVKSNTFTKEQVNNAFKKSYIDYLEKEILRLMKTKKIPNVLRNWLLFFLFLFILKLVLYIILK